MPLMAADEPIETRIEQALAGPHRAEANQARDQYRRPLETLTFFGLQDGMAVLEIWPGGGWYTEVLAPVMRDHGKLTVAGYDAAVPDQPGYRYRLQQQMEERFDANPGIYDQVGIVAFSPPQSASLGEAGSYDMIVTFRSTHGWVADGLAEGIFAEFSRVLKPGGILGVVQHRADPGGDPVTTAQTGYVSEEIVIQMAEKAGLVLDARSGINANPKDSHDHPEGVWTLPPGLNLGDQDREKYLSIGESDRMTLRFRKPSREESS
jgi:predicted methyltransferase